MTITIHRGTHQIGGCVTEISTDTTRIFIDFGTELPDLDGVQPEEALSIPGLTEGTPRCDGVFFTHYHGDHIGNIHRILPGIDLYMGEAAMNICLTVNERLQKAYTYHPESFSDSTGTIDALKRAKTFTVGKAKNVGDISVTPYRVDHSAFDAYMFLIEADGQRILHTGDLRSHGYMGDKLKEVLGLIGRVDALICEGTMLSRDGEDVMTEAELSKRARTIMNENKHVFVLCSSTNIDRIRAFYEAKPRKRPAVCDDYQKDVLNAAKEYDWTPNKKYQFKWVVPDADWNWKLHDWMGSEGFLMFVRATDKYREIMEPYRGNCKVIYSMWSGYRSRPQIESFLDGFDCVSLHTSGHATLEAIRMIMETAKPNKVIPIHIDDPKEMTARLPDWNIVIKPDGVPFEI